MPRWSVRPSITAILALGFGTLIAFAVGAVLLIGLFGARANTGALLRDKAELTLELISGRIRHHLDPVEQGIAYAGERLAAREIDLDEEIAFESFMRGLLAGMPHVSGLAFVRPDLSVRRYDRASHQAYDEDMLSDLRAALALRDAQRDPGAVWTDALWSPLIDEAMIARRAPILREQRLAGVLVAAISTRALSAYVDQISREAGLVAFVLAGREHVLAHPLLSIGGHAGTLDRPLPALADFLDPVLAAIWRPERKPLPWAAAAPLAHASGHMLNVDGRDYVYVWRQIDGYGAQPWFVGVYLPADRIGEEIVRLQRMAITGLGVLIAAVLITIAVGRRVGQPILHLAEAATKLRGFDLANVPRVGRSRVREIDRAARAFDSMIDGLKYFETYVPRTLVRRLMATSGAELISDERAITVMFTDIAGFTGLAADLPAAELATMLNTHFALIGRCIEATEGTIDKYVGDSVMAFWGAPLDQPDHAARAVEAARCAARAIAADNHRRRANGEPAIRVRIGLHTGPVVVGNIGAPGRVNYTVVGDTVNVAQRIEQVGKEVIADADVAVLLSEATRAALGSPVATVDLGSRPLRGRDEPVGVHRLVL
jgi:adenylate cyclase